MKKRVTTSMLAVLVLWATTGTLVAHHSLASFDTTKAVRVRGTMVQFHRTNPNSYILLDQQGEAGQIRRWAVEGPSILQLERKGFGKDGLKAGDVVEVCGYVPKETTVWQIANPDPTATSIAGRLINAETLVTP